MCSLADKDQGKKAVKAEEEDGKQNDYSSDRLLLYFKAERRPGSPVYIK